MDSQLEYAISQYLDGTLPPLESAALEERLATDAEARALLEEYRKLDQALKAGLAKAPAVAWDRLEAQLVSAVARAEPPVRHYSLVAWRRAAAVAMAACLVLVLGIGFLSYRGSAQRDEIAQQPEGTRQVIAIVQGPMPETAPAGRSAVAQVAIGPAPALTDSWRYAETVVSRPTVVLIDRAHLPAQDTDASPF